MFVLKLTHLSALLLVLGLASADPPRPQPRREVFYVGGEYTNITSANVTQQYMIGQIYVEKLTPPIVSRKEPLVFIAGFYQTGTNFLETPDGRPGWASFFLDQGYIVYLSDQASRGRSAWNPSESTGSMIAPGAGGIESIFTATAQYKLWPQAVLHTQWPGTGMVGDPTFDAFFASQVQSLPEDAYSETRNAKAYTALLDKIGPAHVIAHSQAGGFAWHLGDLRPKLVKSLISIEPSGPPFESYVLFKGNPRPWGITFTEVDYEPSAGPNGTFLKTVTIPAKDANHTACIMQADPAKQLVKLAEIPVLVVTAEASFHATHDYCTVAYLRQAGVGVEYLQLADQGIHGNGHMMFMEKNNIAIAQQLADWLAKH